MIIRKNLVIFVAVLFCLMPSGLKAEGGVLLDQEAVGSTVVIEESAIQPELVDEEEMPWWVYLWVGLLVAGVVSMALKSIKQQMNKPKEEPPTPSQSQE